MSSQDPGESSGELVKAVDAIAELMSASTVDELVVEREGFRVRLRRASPAPGSVSPAPGSVSPAPGSASPPPADAPPATPGRELYVVRSPLAGLFYRSPSPSAEPFVREGDQVQSDTVIGLVEAMKVFNEVTAETQGRIARIDAATGAAVEAGAALVSIDTATGEGH
jgi:acetyl-CoA carboxylase biotin carboxyl carrier protein